MSADQDRDHERDAAELDDLAHVPDHVLSAMVARHGLCLGEITHGDLPIWTNQKSPDRELAARLCAGCPVQRECLEFELRTAGAHTVGVWGGLGEDNRRALHAVWRARAGNTAHTSAEDMDESRTDEQKGGGRNERRNQPERG